MGKVAGMLTGHSGGGSTKSSQSSNTTSQQQSWLEKNPQYQALQNNALTSAANFDVPEYQYAGNNQNINQSLAGLAKGVNTAGYNQAYNKMIGQGQTEYNLGNQNVSGATNIFNRLGNMSQSDYQNMFQSEYNSDLVNSEINNLKQTVGQNYADQVQSLNQQANASGGMGNSRAGVAQGVMAGQAAKAIASGTVQFQTAEENNAYQRMQGYLNNQSNAAGQLAGIGQNQTAQGLQQYGAGMGYYSQYNQAQTQNLQNQFQAGQYQRQIQQGQYDVNRQNELLRQSPALARLQYFNQTYLPMANLSSYGTGTSEGTGKNTSPGQGGNLLGGLAGMAGSYFGGMYGGQMGSQAGGMIGGAFGNSYGS